MSNEPEPQLTNRGGLIAGVVVAFVIVYLLAPGPLSYFFKNGGPDNAVARAISILYTPLGFVYQRVDFVRAFYDWYFSLFP